MPCFCLGRLEWLRVFFFDVYDSYPALCEHVTWRSQQLPRKDLKREDLKCNLFLDDSQLYVTILYLQELAKLVFWYFK